MATTTDPYWAWQNATIGRFQTKLNRRVPFMVECESATCAEWLKVKLAFLVPNYDCMPSFQLGSRFQTVYFEDAELFHVENLLDCFVLRYECGAPFASPPSNADKEWTAVSTKNVIQPVKANGQVIGFIDFGCPFAHEQFRASYAPKDRAQTRLFALWDQGGDPTAMRDAAPPFLPLAWRPPIGFEYGADMRRLADVVTTKRKKVTIVNPFLKGKRNLNDYIAQFVSISHAECDEQLCYKKSGYRAAQAPTTHGAAVMDVATGFPDPALSPLAAAGVAPTSDIVFVQLPRYFENANGMQTPVSGLLRTYVLDAVRYIFSCAGPDMPVTINLSYGAIGGPHNGDSILECAIDEAIELRRQAGGATEVVVAAGNWYDSELHASIELAPNIQSTMQNPLIWGNIPDNPTVQFVEIWLDGADAEKCQVRVTPPGNAASGWVACDDQPLVIFVAGKLAAVLVFPKAAAQSGRGKLVLLAVCPTSGIDVNAQAPFGDWLLDVKKPPRAGKVLINAWCERDDAVFGSGGGPRQARFKSHVVTSGTLSSAAHGIQTTVVGAYFPGSAPVSGRVAPDSSEGPGRNLSASRSATAAIPGPNLLAPSGDGYGVAGIAAAAMIGRERARYSGTSIAAASATRQIALLQMTAIYINPPGSPAKPPILSSATVRELSAWSTGMAPAIGAVQSSRSNP